MSGILESIDYKTLKGLEADNCYWVVIRDDLNLQPLTIYNNLANVVLKKFRDDNISFNVHI